MSFQSTFLAVTLAIIATDILKIIIQLILTYISDLMKGDPDA